MKQSQSFMDQSPSKLEDFLATGDSPDSSLTHTDDNVASVDVGEEKDGKSFGESEVEESTSMCWNQIGGGGEVVCQSTELGLAVTVESGDRCNGSSKKTTDSFGQRTSIYRGVTK